MLENPLNCHEAGKKSVFTPVVGFSFGPNRRMSLSLCRISVSVLLSQLFHRCNIRYSNRQFSGFNKAANRSTAFAPRFGHESCLFVQEKRQSLASSGQNWIFFATIPPTNHFCRRSFGTVPRSPEREVCFDVHLGEVTATPAQQNSSLQRKVTEAGVKTLLEGPKRRVLTHFGGM